MGLLVFENTRDIDLVYYKASSSDNTTVVRFVNSEYAGDLDKKSGLTSYFFTLSSCGINWKAPTVKSRYLLQNQSIS